MKMFPGVLLLLIVIGTTAAIPCQALELTPFAVRNFSPTALVHGLSIAETPYLLPAGKTTLHTGFDLANNATINTRNDERILLDGETYVATLGLRYGLSDQLQVGIDLPWVWHSGGFLDSFISDWHDFFGLPEGDRDDLKNDQLDYRYSRNGEERLRLQDKTDSLGDLRLKLAWQFATTAQSAFTLQAQVKAPTGDADKLTGSEAWDVSLAISAQRNFSLGNGHGESKGRGALWGGFGVSWLGDGEVLEEDVEDFAASGWVGAGWSPLDWLSLKVQIDSHTALYDSDLRELGDPAVILTMGGTLGLGEKTFLDVGVGEDLNVNASPDITFHLDLNHRF
jgi:hypothetical protein